MPKRDGLKKVLILGSGPIVIGQACEFDYSGSQACKALREIGIQIVLVNSNPATIMTDPEVADRTYVEPLDPETVSRIMERERPDALLPTLGGQVALNLARDLALRGDLERLGVSLIGVTREAIEKAEDREKFKEVMIEGGLEVPPSGTARTPGEAEEIVRAIGLPVVIRPSFTLGGTGGGIAYNVEEFREMAARGLDASPIREILIEESLIGWKEFELEVMRDARSNCVIVCTIENVDPMGVHTGDSITVAPSQTLTDREFQRLRDQSLRIMRAVGVETGGSNIQFAVCPKTGRVRVIEMNPRVSRSSALASKATGFPIAKIAAKVAVGFTLDEIRNDITRETPASFEPSIDYVAVKIPRFDFAKFPAADRTLTTQMKSVGEVMAMGRTFQEALQKALRSLEVGVDGLIERGASADLGALRSRLITPNPERIFYIPGALARGIAVSEIAEMTGIDPWFLRQIEEIVRASAALPGKDATVEEMRAAKRMGFSDRQIARVQGSSEDAVRARRKALGIVPVFKTVDTCGGEFRAETPYFYSTYEEETEVPPSDRPKVMILGGGPNRIGQGIEFDYCCCHAAASLREEGYEVILVNSNPETVSTDYDTSDRLYFEPVTLEDVLAVHDAERPKGVIVTLGGATPLKLAQGLERAGVPILGTAPEAIDLAEDRKRFAELVTRLGLEQPASGTATAIDEALHVAHGLGYPVLVRPSYVLGGRAMEKCYDDQDLCHFMELAVRASPDHPVLIDRFLDDAIEVDVDAVSDGRSIAIAGILEHIEEAGVHSGDATATLPPYTLADSVTDELSAIARTLALALGVKGLLNVQLAIKEETIYILEVNPRASRTVPFVSKATGIPWAKIAAKVMVGRTLDEMGLAGWKPAALDHISVKKSVFPFDRFPGVDIILGPEMRSTGEVMGVDRDFGLALAKAHAGAGQPLPTGGTVFVSVKDADKRAVIPVAKQFEALGFRIVATDGTYKALAKNGVRNLDRVRKVAEGRPHVIDKMKNREIDLVINTPSGKSPGVDGQKIRALTVALRIPCITTIEAAQAAVNGIASLKSQPLTVTALQDLPGPGKETHPGAGAGA